MLISQTINVLIVLRGEPLFHLLQLLIVACLQLSHFPLFCFCQLSHYFLLNRGK